MEEELLVRYCAPTLAGLKTGSLFSCGYEDRARLNDRLRAWNLALGPKGIRVLPLHWAERRALIYVVRPEGLREDLSHAGARELLRGAGYPAAPARCVAELMRRLGEGGGFPHEIGLFLGYPPSDVKGFLEHRGRAYRCAGCWKVYGDETRARALFRRYQDCTAACLARWADGDTVEALAVRQREL